MYIQRTTANVLGVILTLVGIIGFFTNGQLLLFGVNALHNWIHIITGVLGIIAGTYAAGIYSATYNRTFGIIYAIVTILGFILPTAMAQLLNINAADNILHLVLAIVFLGVGFGVARND